MEDHLAAQAKAADMTINQLAQIASIARSKAELTPLDLAAQDELDRRTHGLRVRPVTLSVSAPFQAHPALRGPVRVIKPSSYPDC